MVLRIALGQRGAERTGGGHTAGQHFKFDIEARFSKGCMGHASLKCGVHLCCACKLQATAIAAKQAQCAHTLHETQIFANTFTTVLRYAIGPLRWHIAALW